MFKKGTSLLVNSRNSRMKIGHKIHHVRETDSTMEACNLLANLGEESGTIVSTNYQESGRGRFKRKWVSPRGDNIQISVLLRPTRNELKYLNMFASLAVLATCDQILDAEGSIKWPNDVQVNGKKRGIFSMPINSKENLVIEKAKTIDNVSKHVENVKVIKNIYLKNKLINFITEK